MVRIHYLPGSTNWAINEFHEGVCVEHQASAEHISFPEPLMIRLVTTPARAVVELDATITTQPDGSLVILPAR